MSYTNQDYPYLADEDRRFAQAFRISEDEFFGMAGGLKAYTQFRLNRDEARQASVETETGERQEFSVPTLPDNVNDAMKGIALPGVNEKDLARLVLEDQIKQVAGILDGIGAGKMVKEQADTQQRYKAESKASELKRIAANNPYGFPTDSQSAKDWAETQYQLRYGVKP
ncbi:MAG: hypothetical protein ABR958_03785 [Dehalococcoidales bacterium]